MAGSATTTPRCCTRAHLHCQSAAGRDSMRGVRGVLRDPPHTSHLRMPGLGAGRQPGTARASIPGASGADRPLGTKRVHQHQAHTRPARRRRTALRPTRGYFGYPARQTAANNTEQPKTAATRTKRPAGFLRLRIGIAGPANLAAAGKAVGAQVLCSLGLPACLDGLRRNGAPPVGGGRRGLCNARAPDGLGNCSGSLSGRQRRSRAAGRGEKGVGKGERESEARRAGRERERREGREGQGNLLSSSGPGWRLLAATRPPFLHASRATTPTPAWGIAGDEAPCPSQGVSPRHTYGA